VGSCQDKNNKLKYFSVPGCENNEEFCVACVWYISHSLIQLSYSKDEEMELNEELKGNTKQGTKSFS